MANFESAMAGAVGGAGIGSYFPGVGTAIGATAGFVAGLFGKSSEEERQARKGALLKSINEAETRRLNDTVRALSSQIAGSKAQASSDAARRALAGGMASQADSFILPATSQVEKAGTQAVGAATESIKNEFDKYRMEAETGFADRPITPSFSDYLLKAGDLFLRQKSYEERLKTEGLPSTTVSPKDLLPGGSPSPMSENDAPPVIQPTSDPIGSSTGMSIPTASGTPQIDRAAESYLDIIRGARKSFVGGYTPSRNGL